MQGTHERRPAGEAGLDPREAARLLEQTKRDAQRKFELSSPLLSVLGAAVVLIAAGSAFAGPRGVWLSDGIGCCVAVLGYAAAQAWLRRGSATA